MGEFEKVRDDLLKKQLGADYKKFEMPRKNMPTENDMGPLPVPPADVKKVKKEKTSVEVERKAKGGKITAANYDKEYGKIYRKAVKKMSSGGSTASKRADGCATKGKTKGRII